jgi:signal transduction histidine kinase
MGSLGGAAEALRRIDDVAHSMRICAGHEGILLTRLRDVMQHHARLAEDRRMLPRKYAVRARRFIERRRRELDVDGLLKSALLASSNAWALIHDGHVRLTNPAFEQMEEALSSEGAGPEHPLLRTLVLEEAKCAAIALHRRRFARDARVIEVTIERGSHERGARTALALVRDVTDQVGPSDHDEMRLAGQVVMGFAHDLNNILGALAMRLEAVERDSTSWEANLAAMKRAVESGTRLLSKMSSIGSAREDPLVPSDLSDIVASGIELAESSLRTPREGGGPIRIHAALGRLPPVTGAPDDLRNVVVNLLLNARDAMPSGGSIEILGRTDESTVTVRVEDEGTGIPPDHLERIFDPFFTTKGSNGRGLGLALARETMTKAGGTIRAGNRASGGAWFELVFPRWRKVA